MIHIEPSLEEINRVFFDSLRYTYRRDSRPAEGFFWNRKHKVEGEMYILDEIKEWAESFILPKIFGSSVRLEIDKDANLYLSIMVKK